MISFDSSSLDTFKGPRLCAVRLQPGSNNILLDNVAQFSSPILYKRRSCNNDLTEPSVHTGISRNSSDESETSIPGDCKTSTETEI